MIVCTAGDKPLILLHLLQQLTAPTTITNNTNNTKKPSSSSITPTTNRIIVFTASIEATHRLFRLCECCGVRGVQEYSSAMGQERRSRIVEDFRRGDVLM